MWPDPGVLLATERRDLKPASKLLAEWQRDWGKDLPPPLARPITQWRPDEAETEFLTEFTALTRR